MIFSFQLKIKRNPNLNIVRGVNGKKGEPLDMESHLNSKLRLIYFSYVMWNTHQLTYNK